ncbi:MAG: FlgD immunoglobulin-like domain containing protein [bacterium]
MTQVYPQNSSSSRTPQNPFSRQTTIRFALPKPCYVRITLQNRMRKSVRVFLNESMQAGHYELAFDGKAADGKRLGPGMYTYRLETDGFVASRKLEIRTK